MILVRLPLVAVGALLGLALTALAGCGSRTGLGGFRPSADGGSGGSDEIATGGTFSGGGTASTGGAPNGGSPAGGSESGGRGGMVEPPFLPDYFKSTNPRDSGAFGAQVTISADGATLAVGVPGDRSLAAGIDGDPFDEGTPTALGAVFVYVRSAGSWVQQAYIKASNPADGDFFGTAVALSDDGNRLVVGAVGEDSSSTGLNGDQTNDDADGSGAVYAFARSGTVWSQSAYIKAPNAEAADQFGKGLALSGDGNTLAVGAIGESSPATGVNGDMMPNGMPYAGAVYVLFDQGFGFELQAYLKASNTGPNDEFGQAIAISGDGNALVVGAPYEDSAATGPFDQSDNSALNAGAAYLFERAGSSWSQTAYFKASNTGTEDNFGASVACSSTCSTIAIGARGERSLDSGVNGNQLDDSGSSVGAVYVHELNGSFWEQVAYVKASNPQSSDFGIAVALSDNGQTLAVGASGESSAASGIDGDQTDTSAPSAGAAYLFERTPSAWMQRAYLKAGYPGPGGGYFGYSLDLDASAESVAIGAPYENGSSPGINGDQTDLTTSTAGAAYVYTFD